MQIARIESDLPWTDFLVLRLLRRWAASRSLGEQSLPNLVELALELGEGAETAVSLHSLFQLTEGCLGRPLKAECCCSRSLAADERAMLALIGAAPATGPFAGSAQIPHGLPGALCWAVASARLALGISPANGVPYPRCPFGQRLTAVG